MLFSTTRQDPQYSENGRVWKHQFFSLLALNCHFVLEQIRLGFKLEVNTASRCLVRVRTDKDSLLSLTMWFQSFKWYL